MFEFKEFRIKQDKCAMKVGTDGVLLGAWTPIDNQPSTILDIGAGTGLLALMMAQRTNAEQIDAVEIDDNAHPQAVENFEESPWADRLFCYHASLEDFANEMDLEYDLIISNPPFYSEDYLTESKSRDQARFQSSMPFDLLIEAVEYFLSPSGVFSVIVPYKEEDTIIRLAAEFEIYPFKVTRVKGHQDAPIKRSLLAFSRQRIDKIPLDDLIIEIERHQYTDRYKFLTKDFYLEK